MEEEMKDGAVPEQVETENVKCDSCGSNMKFDPESQMLYCEHCGRKESFAVYVQADELAIEDALKTGDINEKTRKRILKGEYYPTKNLIFTLALTCGFSEQDTDVLMQTCGFVYDYAVVKDVVVSYLIANKVLNPAMIQAAFDEYKVDGLFFRKAE